MDTVTVHDFVAVDGASTSRAALRLEQGRDFVLAYSSSHGWTTPQSTIDPSAFTLRRGKLYQYRFEPPPLASAIQPINIPEWGQPSHVDDPDHFQMQDLQDFESTDFQASLARHTSRDAKPSHLGKRIQENGLTVNEPGKRPRLESFNILDVIPWPHIIPAPAANYQPVDTGKIPPYQKALPTPVAPYDTAAVNQLLSSKFRRGAWLIPVRGSLPWKGASTAVILEAASDASGACLPTPGAQPRAVMWSPNTLQHFWAFLSSIQQAKHLGPLSLSFRVGTSDASSTLDAVSEPIWESNLPYYCRQQSSKHSTELFDDFTSDIRRAQLESVDFIKIYHDMPYSLSLRNILDAYRYEQADGQVPGRLGANDRKIRILKGARLIFMDERSKAAFLM